MEELSKRPDTGAQKRLIHQYCLEAEEEIQNARTFEDAVKIKEHLCAEFAERCNSSIVVGATRNYIDKLVKRTWEDPKGSSGG